MLFFSTYEGSVECLKAFTLTIYASHESYVLHTHITLKSHVTRAKDMVELISSPDRMEGMR